MSCTAVGQANGVSIQVHLPGGAAALHRSAHLAGIPKKGRFSLEGFDVRCSAAQVGHGLLDSWVGSAWLLPLGRDLKGCQRFDMFLRKLLKLRFRLVRGKCRHPLKAAWSKQGAVLKSFTYCARRTCRAQHAWTFSRQQPGCRIGCVQSGIASSGRQNVPRGLVTVTGSESGVLVRVPVPAKAPAKRRCPSRRPRI